MTTKQREFGGNVLRVFFGGNAMKRIGSVLTVVLPVVVVLGLSIAVVGKAIADSCSGCGCCTYLNWNSSPSTTDAFGTEGDFSFNQVVNWGSENDDGLIAGTITIYTGTGGSVNVVMPSFTPDFFSPYDECCSGVLTIQTSGTLDVDTLDGTMVTKAAISVSSPQRQRTKSVAVESAED